MPLSWRLVYNISAMPHFASIDVGSNTLRILIGEFVDNRIIDIYTDRKITRLGSMVGQTGILQTENMEASLQALSGFVSVINRFRIKHVRALGTSALREAQNSGIFMQRARDAACIQIEIISGEKEAQLTLKGILQAFSPAETGAARGRVPIIQQGDTGRSHQRSLFIMDIGGGSSEWIIYQGEDRNMMGSLPSGVIKLAQTCITADPASPHDVMLLNREIVTVLNNFGPDTGRLDPGATLFIGTGGTFTTVASVDLGLDSYSRQKIHLHRIPLSRLKQMQKTFLQLSLTERKKIRGLEPGRADLIIPGVQFTMKVMELFRFRELIVSDYGLLEGALLEMKEASEKGIPEAGKS